MKPSRLLWFFATATGLLFAAAPPAIDAEQPTVMTALKSTWVRSNGNQENLLVLDQAVTLTGTNLRITCDHLEGVVVGLGDKSVTLTNHDKFKSLVVTGHVHIAQNGREASCGRAEVFPGEDRIVLTETPVLTANNGEGSLIQEGSMITITRGIVEVTNPKITIPELKALGVDPKVLSAPAK
ncbi:MAG: hypothetical protein WCL04_04040 [Verrucomicrobiota bacterium]